MADYGIAIRPTGFVVKFVVSTEDSSGVDDDGLAGHGFGAAHDDHQSAQSSLSAGFFRSELAAERAICSDRRLAVSEASASSGWWP
jgi:hypothetical protein